MSTIINGSVDPVKEERMRRRVADFLGDPAALEGMTGAEIRAAVRMAFNAVRAFIRDDATFN